MPICLLLMQTGSPHPLTVRRLPIALKSRAPSEPSYSFIQDPKPRYGVQMEGKRTPEPSLFILSVSIPRYQRAVSVMRSSKKPCRGRPVRYTPMRLKPEIRVKVTFLGQYGERRESRFQNDGRSSHRPDTASTMRGWDSPLL